MLSKLRKTKDQISPSEFFAVRLRETRRHQNLDQTQLAEMTGIPATSISHFEARSRRPSAGNMIKLAEALDISLDYLVGRTDDPMAHKDFGAWLGEGGLSPEDRALVTAVAERIGSLSKPDSS